MTHSPAAAAAACAPEVSTAAVRCEREATAAARSQFEDTGAALSLCAAGATAIGGYGAYRGYRYGVGAAAVGAAAVGAAAAGAYYRGGCGYDAYGNWVCPGTIRTERRDAVGLCKEPKTSCDGAGDGAVVHVDEREV